MKSKQYNDLLDILTAFPHYLVNQYYRPKLKIGIFCFADMQYIPDSLKEYIIPLCYLDFTDRYKFSMKIKTALINKPKKKSI